VDDNVTLLPLWFSFFTPGTKAKPAAITDAEASPASRTLPDSYQKRQKRDEAETTPLKSKHDAGAYQYRAVRYRA
jgi:hypothetical protein